LNTKKYLENFFPLPFSHQKWVVFSELRNFLENLWRTSPPLISSKHPQREGGIRRGYWRGDPPERLNRGEIITNKMII